MFQLEKGVDGLFDSFARLDTRISSVGQTAAKIGDHLQVKFFTCSIMFALFFQMCNFFTNLFMLFAECRCSEGNSKSNNRTNKGTVN